MNFRDRESLDRMMLVERPSISKYDYFLVLLLLVLSGNLVFIASAYQNIILLIATIVAFSRMALIQKRKLLDPLFLMPLALLALISISQLIALQYLTLQTVIGMLFKFIFGASVIATVINFRLIYLRTMVGLSIVSLIIHIPTLIVRVVFGVSIGDFFRWTPEFFALEVSWVNVRLPVVIHTFLVGEHEYRNAGMFWEPGAFAGYLILALLFAATLQDCVPKSKLNKYLLIIIAAVLSTLSTAGFILLPFALFLFRLCREENRGELGRGLFWTTISLLFIVPVLILLWELPFLGPKITDLYLRGINQAAGWQLSRFGAVIFDWEHIYERPWTGWSHADPELYSLFPELGNFATGNGLTGYVRQMGLLGLFGFLIFVSRGLVRLDIPPISRLFFLVIVTAALSGNSFLTYPLFLALHSIGLETRSPRNFRRELGGGRSGARSVNFPSTRFGIRKNFSP